MVNLDISQHQKTFTNNHTSFAKQDVLAKNSFAARHIGANKAEIEQMLAFLALSSLDDLQQNYFLPIRLVWQN